MNKNLSLAIEKAVEKISPKDKFTINQRKTDKKLDLFLKGNSLVVLHGNTIHGSYINQTPFPRNS